MTRGLGLRRYRASVEIGERAWIMREALERARHDLTLLGGCLHADPAAPEQTFETDVSVTTAWIDRAL